MSGECPEQYFRDAYLVTSPPSQTECRSPTQMDSHFLPTMESTESVLASENISEPTQVASVRDLDVLFLPSDETYWYCDVRGTAALPNGESSCFLLAPNDLAVLNAGTDPSLLHAPRDENESSEDGYEADDELDKTSWGIPV